MESTYQCIQTHTHTHTYIYIYISGQTMGITHLDFDDTTMGGIKEKEKFAYGIHHIGEIEILIQLM